MTTHRSTMTGQQVPYPTCRRRKGCPEWNRTLATWALGLAAPLAVLASLPPESANAAFPGRNGRIAYTDLDNRLVSLRPGRGGDRVVARDVDNLSSAEYKPDGRQIVFNRLSHGPL